MESSAKYYSTPLVLRGYDFWVLRISNSYAWRCPTQKTLLPFFTKHLVNSNAHMDVGVGTGFYLASAHSPLEKIPNLTLLDLNPDSLQTAEARAKGGGYKGELKTVKQSVFEAVPSELHGKFNSISLIYLLHCLPTSFPQKASKVAQTLAPCLTPGPDSVLYGATILGKGVSHNWFGKRLMNLYNKKGFFGNRDDGRDELESGLKAVFESVQIEVVGVVALFVCKGVRMTQE